MEFQVIGHIRIYTVNNSMPWIENQTAYYYIEVCSTGVSQKKHIGVCSALSQNVEENTLWTLNGKHLLPGLAL